MPSLMDGNLFYFWLSTVSHPREKFQTQFPGMLPVEANKQVFQHPCLKAEEREQGEDMIRFRV